MPLQIDACKGREGGGGGASVRRLRSRDSIFDAAMALLWLAGKTLSSMPD